MGGVLKLDEGLQARLDASEALEAGSSEEVELRAGTICAGERIRHAILEAAGEIAASNGAAPSSLFLPSGFAIENLLLRHASALAASGLLLATAHRSDTTPY